MSDDVFGLAGKAIDEKYEIEGAVAQGGFGVVYRGRHRALRKAIAVKVLLVPPDLSENLLKAFLESFAHEAQTIARLEHPAVVRVLDYGVSPMPVGPPAPWMVLDWVSGETLAKHLEARRGQGGCSPAAVLALLRPILEALADAHDQGIVHRDIKPANVMLVSRGDTGASRRSDPSARLLDFGIAKSVSPDEVAPSGLTRTRATMMAFSLPYAAPEQVSGMRTGPWTDVHALGLVVTELLTDSAPYQGNDAMEMQLAVLSPVRPTPARFGFDVGAWEPVLARALSAKPADRYANAGALLTALEADVPAHVQRSGPGAVSQVSTSHAVAATVSAPVVTATLSPVNMPSATAPVASSGRPVVLGAALGLALAVLVGGVAFVGYRSLSEPAMPSSAMPHAAAPAPSPAAAPAPSVDAAPAPVVPVVPAAPIVAAPASPEMVDAGIGPASQRGGRRESGHHRGRDPGVRAPVFAPVAAPSGPGLGNEHLPTE